MSYGTNSSIPLEKRYEIMQALTEKMRLAYREWRRWDSEAKQCQDIVAACLSTADGTLALAQARQLMENANKALGDYQKASRELTEFMVHGILPSGHVDT